jgi:peptidoglycan hydrolase-like protein with peptidoglycan-binding domain
MIPKVGGHADSSVGDPIAAWLIQNAEALGMQYLIWNRMRWSGGQRPAFAPYTGGRPHDDHIHLELNRDGAAMRTAWFRSHPPPHTCVHLETALPRNRRWGRRLGWLSRLHDLLPLLGVHDRTPDQTTFAFALAKWQLTRGLTPDGVLGPRTWRLLRRELETGFPSAPSMEASVSGVQQDPWVARSMDERAGYVMQRLVQVYGLTSNGAAGLTGNLVAESGLLPSRIEGRRSGSPLRTKDHCGRWRNFSPQEVMARRPCGRGVDCRGCPGPRLPGVGLAQWSYPSRRAGLFRHAYQGGIRGAAVLFDMDAQLDYLVWELRNRFSRLHRLLRRPGVSLGETTWRVLRDFERPAPIVQNPTGAAAQRVFRRRMGKAMRALEVYCRQWPPMPASPRELVDQWPRERPGGAWREAGY